ncbi:MAG: efflux RND transporter permease subunit [Bacteroidetes bacterium]|nr:efflux RND transporter permease subunit [Bacteroidota bacterium]
MKNFFTTYKNPISVFIFLIIAGGIFSFIKMQTSLFPEITFPKIKVIADAGLQPVDKMIMTVTKPLENTIKQIPGLEHVRSTTSRGSCEISALVNWDADMDKSQLLISSKINEIKNTLPPGTDITIEKMNPSILPVMGYSLESKTKSPVALKQIALYTIRPFLSQVEGVSEVKVTGGKSKEYWITLDKEKMNALKVTPSLINNALQQSNFIQSNGYLNDYHLLYLTVTDAQVHSLNDLQNLIISTTGQRIIQMKDIGTVSIREGKEYIKINANGKEGVLIAVIKQPEANLVDLSKNIQLKIDELKKILPSDIQIRPYYDQADFVQDAIHSVSDSLWIGLLLALLVAILFLRSVKAGATILITIPVTLGLIAIVMHIVGYTLNIMTLGAIAASIGLVIDDAIVVIEQIHRSHEEKPDEKAPGLIQHALQFLFPAMVGSSLSTIVIFLPFLVMSGVAGAYFTVMTNTMIISLTSSFFITWICLPVIYLWFAGKKKSTEKKQKGAGEAHQVKTQKWVSFFIRKPWISIVFIILLMSSIFYIFPKLETGFLPEMDEGSIVLDYNTPPGTSLDETDRILHQVEKIILANKDVASYSRRTGTQMGFFITEPNNGDYLIQLNKNRKHSTDEVISDLRNKIESSQPALQIDFGQVIGDMLGDLMSSAQPVEVKIFGSDASLLKKLSGDIAQIIDSVKGTADVFDGITIAGPSLSIFPNYNALAFYGINPTDFQNQVQLSLEGNVSGKIFEENMETPIRLIYPGNTKNSISDMSNFPIFSPNGQVIRLSDLATIQINSGDAEVQREDLQTVGIVSARLDNRDLGSVMKDITSEISKKIHLPKGYHIEYAGAYAEQQKSFSELVFILVSSCLLVFCVILFLYKDFRMALSILIIAILGISGSYIALFVTHTPLNVGSYTGLIMMVGIIGENAIFTCLQYFESRRYANVDQAIIYAISTRLRPKLMTSIGAIIALMPLALGIGTGAQMHQPLAISVIGGFIIALPLLLIVLPTFLRLIYHSEK